MEVRAQRRDDITVNTGYGSVSKATYAGTGLFVDMERSEFYPSLAEFLSVRVPGFVIANGEAKLRGKSGPAMIIVDGIPLLGQTFSVINDMTPLSIVEAVFVSKDAVYGKDGAIVITTRLGRGLK